MRKQVFYLSFIILSLAFASLGMADVVFHFGFENDAIDNSGNGNNGTLVNGASFSAGQFGQALDVNGVNNQHVNAGDVAFMDSPATFTVAYWFLRRSDTGSTSPHGINGAMFAKSVSGSDDNIEIGSRGSQMQIYLDTQQQDGPNPFSVEAGIQNNTWHHVALTYDKDRTSEMELYVDGNLITQQSQWGGNLTFSGFAPITFGFVVSNNTGEFDGLIDEMFLFDEALNEGQIDNLLLSNNLDGVVVPEPSSILLFLSGLVFFLGKRFSKKN